MSLQTLFNTNLFFSLRGNNISRDAIRNYTRSNYNWCNI